MWVYRAERSPFAQDASTEHKQKPGHIETPFHESYAAARTWTQRIAKEPRVPKPEGYRFVTEADAEMHYLLKAILLRPVYLPEEQPAEGLSGGNASYDATPAEGLSSGSASTGANTDVHTEKERVYRESKRMLEIRAYEDSKWKGFCSACTTFSLSKAVQNHVKLVAKKHDLLTS